MSSDLALFTASFPYGNSETFLENEIGYLAKGFNRIFIFPMDYSGNKRNLPINAEVICLDQLPSSKKKKQVFIKNRFSVLSILSTEIFLNKGYKNPVLMQLDYLLKFYFLAEQLEAEIDKNNLKNSLFYSYWFEQWASVLSIAKRKKVIKKFISRAHGFDVYEERQKSLQIPFRKLQLKQVNQVFCISNAGLKYLQKKHPEYTSKYKVSYLGTNDPGVINTKLSVKFQLLSVSNLIPLKRVSLIIDILRNMSLDVQWTHYGDGQLMNQLKEEANRLPANVSVDFKGRVINEELLNNMKNSYFDLFINVSESEGLPVSIMEAISFGIPVIATDVGGTSEIVNKQTGVLLDIDFNPNKAAVLMEGFLKKKARNKPFRKGVRQYWKENFDAEKNYLEFVKQLKII